MGRIAGYRRMPGRHPSYMVYGSKAPATGVSGFFASSLDAGIDSCLGIRAKAGLARRLRGSETVWTDTAGS